MLPLWPETGQLLLGEKTLTMSRRGKVHSVLLPMERPEHIDFTALQAALPVEMQKLGGHKLRIILANYWVRYLVVPWQPHVYAHRDWLALAQNRLRERYGARAADWDVQISMQGYRQPILAVAIDKALAEGLDRLAELNRWQIEAIEPAFAALVNRYPRHWRGDSWLMMADHNRVLLAESSGGIWQRFSLMLSTPDMLTQHAMTLVQQARQFNPDNRKRRLYLYRGNTMPKQDFIEDMDIRLLAADWLKSAAGQER